MTQANLFDPGPVNGATKPFCTCSQTPHTATCRADRWAVKRAAQVSKEFRRQAAAKLLILGRLQDGPALAAELVAAGGGYRYSARLLELRAAGHNILSENLGDGVWRYTLVLP